MIIDLKISGMHCMHCVSSVKSALSEIDGVLEAEVSLEKGTATVKCNDSVSKDELINAVLDIGFEAE